MTQSRKTTLDTQFKRKEGSFFVDLIQDLKLIRKKAIIDGDNKVKQIILSGAKRGNYILYKANNNAIKIRNSADKLFLEAENLLAFVKMLKMNNLTINNLKIPKLVILPTMPEEIQILPIAPLVPPKFEFVERDHGNNLETFHIVKNNLISSLNEHLRLLTEYANAQSNYLVLKACHDGYKITKAAYTYYEERLQHAVNIYNELDNIIKTPILDYDNVNISFIPNPDDITKPLLVCNGRSFALPTLTIYDIAGIKTFGTSYTPSKYPYFHGLFKHQQLTPQPIPEAQNASPMLKK